MIGVLCEWEIGRLRRAREVNESIRTQHNGRPRVVRTAAEQKRANQSSLWIKPQEKRVCAACGRRHSREIRPGGRARDVDRPARVGSDRCGEIGAAITLGRRGGCANVGGIKNGAAIRTELGYENRTKIAIPTARLGWSALE